MMAQQEAALEAANDALAKLKKKTFSSKARRPSCKALLRRRQS